MIYVRLTRVCYDWGREVKMSEVDIQKEIEEITKQIIQQYKPEKIILFGSYAKGDFTEDSDLDFLVIKKGILSLIGRERARELRKLIKKKVAADFLIYRPEEFNRRLKMGDPFLKLITKEGKVLYGS